MSNDIPPLEYEYESEEEMDEVSKPEIEEAVGNVRNTGRLFTFMVES